MMERVLRSLLFTPATRTGAFDKALASDADCVCLDLEDAVPLAQKAEARPAALAWLGAGGEGALRGLRMNALSTGAGMAELAALAQVAPDGGLLMLPKVGSAEDLRLAAAVLDAFKAAPAGLGELDGKLIGAPVIKGMLRRLARARVPGVL